MCVCVCVHTHVQAWWRNEECFGKQRGALDVSEQTSELTRNSNLCTKWRGVGVDFRGWETRGVHHGVVLKVRLGMAHWFWVQECKGGTEDTPDIFNQEKNVLWASLPLGGCKIPNAVPTPNFSKSKMIIYIHLRKVMLYSHSFCDSYFLTNFSTFSLILFFLGMYIHKSMWM